MPPLPEIRIDLTLAAEHAEWRAYELCALGGLLTEHEVLPIRPTTDMMPADRALAAEPRDLPPV
ncbi:MAG: hypothetical protein AAFU49_02510 [Pseudomonadota bacterium]